MVTTTLNKIGEHSPCKDGWEKLLNHLGKTKTDDEPLAFKAILESNGLIDTLWCLRSLDKGYHPKIRLMAADFAERVLHIYEKKYPNDNRPRLAIKAARDYANGSISEKDLKTAEAFALAASAAAYAASAYDAAYYTEREIQSEILLKYFGEEK